MFWSEPGQILILLTLPSDMFWSEPGRDVRVPVDPHTVGPYLQTCFGLSQVEM